MDMIIGHQNLDFDCVASMIAVKKLYPEARIYLQPTAEGSVLEFLNLYRDHFSFFRYSEFHDQPIERVIIVDTNRRERLGPYKEALDKAGEIIIFDHHSPDTSDIDADDATFDSIGALITLLVEKIRKKAIQISPFEATVFMLGLHQETGGLQFGNTTTRDYEAGRYLSESGADLDIVQNFCNRQLTDEQLDLFNELLTNSRSLSINDVPVTIASAERDEYVPEVAVLAHKLQDMENVNFLALFMRMGDRIQLVLRNRYDQVDVGKIAEQFGGGGHARAASATISGVTLDESKRALIDILKKQLKPRLTAREIMSSPVHSIRPDLPVEEAHELMLRLGHHGLPITDEDSDLIGIITRTDVDKAIRHELEHAPVKGFMNPEVISIEPDTGLQELRNILSNEQIGRLPVLENGELIGIVTRTDLIKVFHKQHMQEQDTVLEKPPVYSSEFNPDNVSNTLEAVLSEEWIKRLRNWGEIAAELDDTLFLVGGCVRDILMEESTKDFDFMVENDGIRFANEVAKRENAEVFSHKKFKTAVVTLPNDEKIDFATARSEYYTHPAALPDVEVEYASVAQDLRRRDFTINAMAVNLAPDAFGNLLDLFGGRQDLQHHKIRVLYATSFLDDPTRIFRAIRFAGRLNFELEERTLFHLKNALRENTFEQVSGDRLCDELTRIFGENDPWPIIEKLFELNVLQTLHPDIEPHDEIRSWFKSVPEIENEYTPKNSRIIYFSLLFEPLSSDEALKLGKRLNLRRRELEILEHSTNFADKLGTLSNADANSEIYEVLDSVGHEEVLLTRLIIDPETVTKKINLYLDDLRYEDPIITGDDLKEFGIEPGPKMGEILDELFNLQLDRTISTKNDAVEYLKKHY